MVAAITKPTGMIKHEVTFEKESISDRLSQISQDIQTTLIPSKEKKGPVQLVTLKEQVEVNHTKLLRNSALMFGTY